jgi:hypothetical protein
MQMRSPSTPAASAAAAQSRTGSAELRADDLPRGRANPGTDFTIGPRASGGAVNHTYDRRPDDPVYRPLRIYALDPSASVRDGAHAIVNVPYEPVRATSRGLRGAILEIVDDASTEQGDSSDAFDLDDPFVLMQQGTRPSPEDPQFRRQMAYAVASTTYATFQQALGREVAWGFRRLVDGDARLHIRPSIDDLQNAFYDPARGELRFGSFMASSTVTGRNVPRGKISLCLSHDVLVHEMSHALLDGMRSHFLHPSNLDVLAFHEGFADLIAIFQRFSYRDVVGRAIRGSRGELSIAKLLTDIAAQFAQAMNATGALRSAVNVEEHRYEDTVEPHQRGEILVAAVFDAFNRVYQRKTASLLRLSTGGTGVLPPGEISELLSAQLTERACSLASQFLAICIRAIDYCPPVDITFGEFLRAVVSADLDLVPDDPWGYREAWIDAFAKRRIYPANVQSLSEDALRWRGPQSQVPPEPELSFAQLRFDGDPGRAADLQETLRQASAFGQLAADRDYRAEFGLAANGDPLLCGDEVGLPVVESVRSSRRVGPSGQVVFDLIAEITQRRCVRSTGKDSPGFDFFGGATVVLDPQGKVRYVIRKSVLDSARLERQRDFLRQQGSVFFGLGPDNTRLPEAGLLLRLHDITRPQFRSGAGARALMRGVTGGAEAAAARRYLAQLGDSGAWMTLLKTCLNRCMKLTPMLDGKPEFDLPTERAVNRLQTEHGANVDGIVGPATWSIIGKRLGYSTADLPLDASTPAWIRGLISNNPAVVRLKGIDIDSAIDMYEFSFGLLSPSQRSGLASLLTSLAGDGTITDLRWAAYMLATTKHECADTWRPVEEVGKGKGRPYGIPVSVVDEHGNRVDNTYYGRGYVQLTWRENYLEVGQAIGLGRRLEIHPELALDAENAHAIMSHGMRHGIFTGRPLSKYINATETDYVNARRVINGTDRAAEIAAYATRLETMLQASVPLQAQ